MNAREMHDMVRRLKRRISATGALGFRRKIQAKIHNYSMIPAGRLAATIELCRRLGRVDGCVVECGVWRGGMSAAMADTLPGRVHFLFDSFEGLPLPTSDDGEWGQLYLRDPKSPEFYDSCIADPSFAEAIMRKSAAREFHLVKGWFKDTLPSFRPPSPIAVLRLDADWYDSTMECLKHLFPHVAPGGLILIDDYLEGEGCARAVHEYLVAERRRERIRELRGVFYISKIG